MKILIVDDNVAVQEIMKDILVERDYIVRLASSVDEAFEKTKTFEPDVVMLDSQIGEDDGMRFISRVTEEMDGFDLKVILIKSSSEIAPRDVPAIKGSVNKPFKSTDILEALDSVKESEVEAEVTESAKKRARKQQRSLGRVLFSRKKPEPLAFQELSDSGIVFGRSYVVFESDPRRIYDFVSKFNPSDYSVLVVTSERAKAIKEMFSYGTIDVLALTNSGRMGSEDIHALGTMMTLINDFIMRSTNPVIVFDKFGEIIEANGLNRSLVMLQQLMSPRGKSCTFAISVDDDPLTDKDCEVILHGMEEYRE